MHYLPTSNLEANALYFHIGTLAYNLFILFRRILDTRWQRHTIQTLRYKLYHIAGKVIRHARRMILKIPSPYVEMVNTLRTKVYRIRLE